MRIDFKYKIIFLLHLPPPVHGSSVVGLSIKESKIINRKFKGFYINLLASHNIEESGIIKFNKLLGFIITWFKVLYSIIINRPNLCYFALTTTGAAFYKDMLLVALLKLFRIKRIYHLHNKGISKRKYKTFSSRCYQFVFKNSEVILLSKRLYPDIQHYVPESNIHICPNGICDINRNITFQASPSLTEIPRFNSNELTTKHTNDKNKQVQILFLSNLIESKGVYILLDACVLLKKKQIPFQCIFIGGESDVTASQFYERVNQLGLCNEVIYKGEKHGIEKNIAFSDADIFAFPTYYYFETFGLVILEAMQQSKPVVSTFEGGIPDLIEDGVTGFLVPQKDYGELANKLELLIKDPKLRNQMGAAGRKKYENEFILEKFENRLTDILLSVIEKK